MPGELNFQARADTRFIVQRLRETQVGETVPYDELCDLISKPRDKLRNPLRSARAILLREDQMAFGVIRDRGLRRLNDKEIVGTSGTTAKKIRSAARRGVKTLTAVADFSALTRDDQMRHSASVSIFAAVAEMTTEKSLARVGTVVGPVQGALPIGETLDAFREGSRHAKA